MKKFKVAPHTAKRIKTIIAAAMALALAVPTASIFSSKAASSVDAEGTVDVPAPIMTVDFETGFMGEASKNGLEVVKSEEVIKFAEEKDANGNYKYDDAGHQIYGVTETPFIEAGEYKKGVVGNQPTTAYDSKMGNVLSLDSTVKIPEFVKKESDALDATYPVGTVLQKAVTAESQIKIKNPFAGLDLKETYNGTAWTKGVSISYWVKAAEKKSESGEVVGGLNSSLINFNNSSRVVMQKDDYMKYVACQEYSESDSRYSMGTQEIMTDADGNTYEVYKDYGVLLRFNPSYPKNSEEATVKGGWFITDKTGASYIKVTDSQGNPYTITSLYGEGTKVVDEGLYNSFKYKYAATDDFANGVSSKSKIREEAIKGSMSITAGNDFVFRADHYDDEEITMEDGTKGKVAVQGTKVTNPNSDQSEKEFAQFDVYNQFFFNMGNEALPSKTLALTEETQTLDWHFVTTVIQNDMVYFYVDGELADPLEYYFYMGGTSNESGLQMYNAGKAFNQGRGCGYMDGIFGYPASNVTPWSENGTASDSPADGCSVTMLEWLSDLGTELYIGGKGYAAGCQSIDLDYDTVDGTMVDDLNFYDVPLTAEQAKAIYDNAKAAKEAVPAANEIESFTFDEGTLTGTNGTTLENAETNGAESQPSLIEDATRGTVLSLKNSNAAATSAVKLSKNPFAGMKDSLTGATVNFWVKEPGQGVKNTVSQSVAVSFADTPKVMNYDKMATSLKGTSASSSLYITTACDGFFYEGGSSLVYQSLGNNAFFSTKRNGNIDESKESFEQESLDKYNEYLERLQSVSSWHMVTLVMKNSGLYVYFDGEELSNNMYDKVTNAPNYFGLRFYDGYYGRIYDGYKFNKNNCGSNNQFGLPLLTFLTDETTSAYVGYANKLGSASTYEKTFESYFDNIRYFGSALSADQIKEIYTQEKIEDVNAPDGDGNNGNNTDNSQGNNQTVGGNVEGDTVTFSYGGVVVTADVKVIPADAKLVLGMLGTTSDADAYKVFEDIIAKNGEYTSKQMVVYTVKSEDGSVTPNGKFKLTFDIPAGYDVTNLVVMGEDGTVYEGVLSEDKTKITIETDKFGNYAVIEKVVSKDDGSEIAAASTTAGKTGDDSNIVLPIIIIAVAGAALAVVYKKRKATQV